MSQVGYVIFANTKNLVAIKELDLYDNRREVYMLRTFGQINPKKYRSTLIRVMEILAFISVNEKVNYTKIVTHCNVSNKLLSRIRTKLLKLGYIIHTKNLGDGTRSENYLTITNRGIEFLNHFNQMKNEYLELEDCRDERP